MNTKKSYEPPKMDKEKFDPVHAQHSDGKHDEGKHKGEDKGKNPGRGHNK